MLKTFVVIEKSHYRLIGATMCDVKIPTIMDICEILNFITQVDIKIYQHNNEICEY